MGQVLMENKFAKIAIIGNEDALFCVGKGEDSVICQGVWVILANGRDIMSRSGKKARNACLDVFIKQELHTAGVCGLVAFSCCWTNWFAYARHALTSSSVSRG